MDIAERNRAIKRTLEAAFGRGKVRVRGSRGTAYGWVSVSIDWTPLDQDHAREMSGKCSALLHAAKINLGTAYTDDDCRYTMDKCHIGFNPARYYRTSRNSDGSLSVLTDRYNAEWQSQAEADAAAVREAA